jgi:hypothetical protein
MLYTITVTVNGTQVASTVALARRVDSVKAALRKLCEPGDTVEITVERR